MKKEKDPLENLPIDTSKESCPDPFEMYEKGKKYDALKEQYDKLETRYNESYAARLKVDAQRDELLKIVKELYEESSVNCEERHLTSSGITLKRKVEQLIKTCEND